MAMHNYKNMQIWKDAMDLAQDIYALAEHFPVRETYGIISQMTRAAVLFLRILLKAPDVLTRILHISYPLR